MSPTKRIALTLALTLGAWTSFQAAPKLRGVVDLTIGTTDDNPDYSFGRISSIAIGSDGRIYIGDAQDQFVRVFSEAGKFLYRIGAKGSGPGEFTSVAAMAFAPDGALWVRDEGNSRYQSFVVGATSARYRSTIRMLQATMEGRRPLAFDERGNVIEISAMSGLESSPYRILRSTLDTSGKVIKADTIMEPPQDSIGVHLVRYAIDSLSRGMRYFYAPFAAMALVAHASNGDMARAVSSKYAVLWTSPAGQRRHLLQRDVVGPEPTAAERKTSQEFMDMQAGVATRLKATLPTFRVPQRKPPLTALRFSRDGELWVERTVSAGKPREADIYDRSGRLVASVEWPEHSLSDYRAVVAGRTLIAVARDSNDVERVVRYRFR